MICPLSSPYWFPGLCSSTRRLSFPPISTICSIGLVIYFLYTKPTSPYLHHGNYGFCLLRWEQTINWVIYIQSCNSIPPWTELQSALSCPPTLSYLVSETTYVKLKYWYISIFLWNENRLKSVATSCGLVWVVRSTIYIIYCSINVFINWINWN